MGKIQDFKELRIWQAGMKLARMAHLETRAFPKTEIFSLSAQIKRAAISIPSNIAEGFKRYHLREYRQFLRIALGSLAELETQIILANELGYLSNEKAMALRELGEQISKMTTVLIRRIGP